MSFEVLIERASITVQLERRGHKNPHAIIERARRALFLVAVSTYSAIYDCWLVRMYAPLNLVGPTRQGITNEKKRLAILAGDPHYSNKTSA